MPQRNMHARPNTDITGRIVLCTAGKKRRRRCVMPQKNARGTKFRQTERKTCAAPELV